MEIMRFVKYLILPITILCSSGYSAQVQSNNVTANNKLFSNMQVLVTDANHKKFPNAVFKLYLEPFAKGDFFLTVKTELGNPDSKDVKVHIQNGKCVELSDELLISRLYKTGIAEYNGKYYLVPYAISEEDNEYVWWHLVSDTEPNCPYYTDDYFEEMLGTTPVNNNNDRIKRHHLLRRGKLLTKDECLMMDIAIENIRCYTRSKRHAKNTIQVHKELGYPTSKIINIDLVDGKFISDDELFDSEDGFFKCGIVRYNGDYYFAAYSIDENNNNEYNWWCYDRDTGDYELLGSTPVF